MFRIISFLATNQKLFSTIEDTYTFSDGTNLTFSGDFDTGVTWTSGQFTSWNTNQPSSTSTTRENQDCVKVRSDGMWDDISCVQEKNYACQKDTAVILPTTTTTTTTSTTTTTTTTTNTVTTGKYIYINTYIFYNFTFTSSSLCNGMDTVG